MAGLLLTRILICTPLLFLTGCSSIMTHAGPSDGYYPGSKNSLEMLKDENTGWIMRPLLAIDLPFTAIMDTLLIPLDYVKSDSNPEESSPKKRIEALDKQTNTTLNHNQIHSENNLE
ncbi:YceK/YidQ family lipoprotein [Providencia stuartii]|uniref:YceK/YidQ family lipoprotein n=1 Tax=Providencia stuartii TaxID=588 RepID=UPI0018C70EB5|nr:YceK/YidQ family lipoprotein [Providencia stuartii]MBG5920413.1 YceK/YidQ family lipoprotein [Providencia stuartii]